MKATHTNYKHPRHLRVVYGDGFVGCMSPSHSQYDRLKKTKGLKDWRKRKEIEE